MGKSKRYIQRSIHVCKRALFEIVQGQVPSIVTKVAFQIQRLGTNALIHVNPQTENFLYFIKYLIHHVPSSYSSAEIIDAVIELFENLKNVPSKVGAILNETKKTHEFYEELRDEIYERVLLMKAAEFDPTFAMAHIIYLILNCESAERIISYFTQSSLRQVVVGIKSIAIALPEYSVTDVVHAILKTHARMRQLFTTRNLENMDTVNKTSDSNVSSEGSEASTLEADDSHSHIETVVESTANTTTTIHDVDLNRNATTESMFDTKTNDTADDPQQEHKTQYDQNTMELETRDHDFAQPSDIAIENTQHIDFDETAGQDADI